jgi:hypothetical protein
MTFSLIPVLYPQDISGKKNAWALAMHSKGILHPLLWLGGLTFFSLNLLKAIITPPFHFRELRLRALRRGVWRFLFIREPILPLQPNNESGLAESRWIS